LGKIKDARAVEHLIDTLEGNDRGVWRKAEEALEEIEGK
jgi:HEAT repeat protein